MGNQVLTMVGDQDVVIRKVSDLQRGYNSVLSELAKGHSVVIQRGEDLVAVIVDPSRYNEAMRKASKTEELERQLAHMRTMLDLALAGGPSLEDVRQKVAKGNFMSGADARKTLLGE